MNTLSALVLLGLLGVCLGAGGGISPGSTSDGGRLTEDSHVVYSGPHFVSVGEKFSLSCVMGVDDYLRWTFNGKPIVPGELGYTTVHGPGRQGYIISRLMVVRAFPFHAGDYTCTGLSRNIHSVYVKSGSVTETEDTKRLRVTKPLIITCVANATNLPTIWTKDGVQLETSDHVQLFSNTTLYIASATLEDTGNYTCKTGSDVEPRVIYVVELSLQKHLPKSTTVLENDKLSLTCQVEGDPIPSVQWLKDGEPVEESVNSTRLVFSDNEYEVPNASLLIKPVLKSDSGNYVCLISQYSIQINTTTVVRVRDIYAALWPFLGIVAEVIILCLIIFIYEKKRIRPNFEESDSDHANDMKNNINKKENEVRQRK